MKAIYFAKRNFKEVFRDPLSLLLGVLLPVMLILLFTTISKNAPIEVFKPVNIVPGITIFGFTFTTMFLGLLMAKDKSSSFLTRLFVSPLSAMDFLVGYAIPLFPFTILIGVSCLVVGVFVGLPISWGLLYTFLSFVPFIVFSVFLGVFLGTIFSESQVMAFGNIYIIAGSFLGGAWMDINMLGDGIKSVAEVLPFFHAIEAGRILLSGRTDNIFLHLSIVSMYAIIFFLLSLYFFNRKMKSDDK